MLDLCLYLFAHSAPSDTFGGPLACWRSPVSACRNPAVALGSLKRAGKLNDRYTRREQQRLGMARLFYHRPRYAILDECTSGVTVDMEERFCSRVKALGCTCITISHRPALVRSSA